jgi:membrane protein required for colicin V production
MMSLSILDWVIVAVILMSTLQALSQGFFREFFSFVGAVAGYLLAAWEYPHLAAWLAHYTESPWTANITAFFAIFVLVAVLAGIVGRISSWAVRGVGLRWFDRLLGTVFGFVRGVVVSAVIVLALAAFAPRWGLQESRIAPFIMVGSRALIWAAPAELRQRFWDGWNLLRTVPEHIPMEHNDREHR